jgi:hypothetical protein
MFNQQSTILDLPKHLKLAREHAILGIYSEASSLYKKLLKIIQT